MQTQKNLKTEELKQTAANNLLILRKQIPLVHNITNYVVMNFTANMLLSLGASPIMAHARQEMKDIVNISNSLVINIGTLSEKWIESMLIAGKYAEHLNKPIILDPVGNGASFYRTDTVDKLINEVKFSIIRGNASEIIALAKKQESKTKGVDSVHSSNDAISVAQKFARDSGVTIVVSGKEDIATNGKRTYRLSNGTSLLSSVTGTGCAATAVIGAFLGIEKDPLTAAISGICAYNIAAELAENNAKGPGSFVPAMFDALYNLTPEDIISRAAIDEV